MLVSSLEFVEKWLRFLKQVPKKTLILNPLVTIETSKESIKFAVNGEIGGGSIVIKANDSEKPEEKTLLEVDEPVSLSFALRYLNLFNKASNLSTQVVLSMSNDTPLVVEYKIEKLGSLRFYLAPKITDEEGQ
jgi:proliferating cell nuclear antigen